MRLASVAEAQAYLDLPPGQSLGDQSLGVTRLSHRRAPVAEGATCRLLLRFVERNTTGLYTLTPGRRRGEAGVTPPENGDSIHLREAKVLVAIFFTCLPGGRTNRISRGRLLFPLLFYNDAARKRKHLRNHAEQACNALASL